MQHFQLWIYESNWYRPCPIQKQFFTHIDDSQVYSAFTFTSGCRTKSTNCDHYSNVCGPHNLATFLNTAIDKLCWAIHSLGSNYNSNGAVPMINDSCINMTGSKYAILLLVCCIQFHSSTSLKLVCSFITSAQPHTYCTVHTSHAEFWLLAARGMRWDGYFSLSMLMSMAGLIDDNIGKFPKKECRIGNYSYISPHSPEWDIFPENLTTSCTCNKEPYDYMQSTIQKPIVTPNRKKNKHQCYSRIVWYQMVDILLMYQIW